jgi:hypothetical protein
MEKSLSHRNARGKPGKSNAAVAPEPEPATSADDRIERIAVTAYYMAEARGFATGHEMEDRLQAEASTDGGENRSQP